MNVAQLFAHIVAGKGQVTGRVNLSRQQFIDRLLLVTKNLGRDMIYCAKTDQRKMVVSKLGNLINAARNCDSLRLKKEFISLLTDTVWAFDYRTDEHQKRVAGVCELVARQVPGSVNLADLKVAARLHDLGKITWPKDFLDKKPPLSVEDRLLIESHIYFSLFLMEKIGFLNGPARIIQYNHVYDGYPPGIDLDTVPLEGQILSAVDCFDALTSPRRYRGGRNFSRQEALDILSERPYSRQVIEAIAKSFNIWGG